MMRQHPTQPSGLSGTDGKYCGIHHTIQTSTFRFLIFQPLKKSFTAVVISCIHALCVDFFAKRVAEAAVHWNSHNRDTDYVEKQRTRLSTCLCVCVCVGQENLFTVSHAVLWGQFNLTYRTSFAYTTYLIFSACSMQSIFSDEYLQELKYKVNINKLRINRKLASIIIGRLFQRFMCRLMDSV